MTFITNIILISFLISSSTAFTALSVSNVERRIAAAEQSPTARFYISNAYSYEVGIGKNLPLSSDFERNVDDNTSGSEEDIYEAARYMVEHESVQKFPSPLDTPQQNHEEATIRKDEERAERIQARTNKRKSLPKVEPKRQLEDVLFILTEDDLDERSSGKLASTTSSRHPVMVKHHQNRQIDINSIWVEMLIHDQQNTAMAALQRA